MRVTKNGVTAYEAIRQSIEQDTIVHLPYDDDTATDLLAECDDSAESDTETEYWGGDGEDRWRVHVTRRGGA